MMRFVNLAAIIVIAAMAFGVYQAKTRARADAQRVEELEAEFAEVADDVRVLTTEIASQENLADLRELAERELGLLPIDPLRVVTIGEAPLFLNANGWSAAGDHGRPVEIRTVSEPRR